MPLFVWSPFRDLLRLFDEERCITHLWNVNVGIHIGGGFPYSWSWNFWYEKESLWLFTVSPTYALFVPFAVLATELYYGHEYAMVRGAVSLWNSSERQGKLYLYNLLEFVIAFSTYTGLSHNHLYIEESESISPHDVILLRLMPQLLL